MRNYISGFFIFSLMTFVFIGHAKSYLLRHKTTNNRQITNLQTNASSLSGRCDIQQPPGFQFNLHNKEVCAYITVGTLPDPLSPKYNFNLNYQYYCNHYGFYYYKWYWDWGMTRLYKPFYDNKIALLFTSHGQCFSLNKSASQWVWRPCNTLAKTTNIKFDSDNPFDHLLITYADGSQETIDQQGDEIRLKQPNGRVINFSYDHHMPINIVSGDGRQKIISKYLKSCDCQEISSYQDGKQISHIQFYPPYNSDPGFIIPDKNNILTQIINTEHYPRYRRVEKFMYPPPADLTQSLIYSCDKGSGNFIGNICEIEKVILSRRGCSNTKTIG